MLCGLALREPARRHAEVLIDAAGLAIAWIAAGPFLFDDERAAGRSGRSSCSAPASGWWRSARSTARPGPPIWASLNLVLFILVVGDDDDALAWWPLVLLAGGIAMLVAGLRPRRPLPPEPDPYRAGEAPLAARADDGEIVVRPPQVSRERTSTAR